MIYRALADIVFLLHFAIVLFVVFGLLLTVAGLICRWTWVRNFWFRFVHLAMIVMIVGQAWVGVLCPFTIWEQQLRAAGGLPTSHESFIQQNFHWLLFYDWEPWVFTVVYTIFGLLVVATFVFGPPRLPAALRRQPST